MNSFSSSSISHITLYIFSSFYTFCFLLFGALKIFLLYCLAVFHIWINKSDCMLAQYITERRKRDLFIFPCWGLHAAESFSVTAQPTGTGAERCSFGWPLRFPPLHPHPALKRSFWVSVARLRGGSCSQLCVWPTSIFTCTHTKHPVLGTVSKVPFGWEAEPPRMTTAEGQMRPAAERGRGPSLLVLLWV